MGGEENTEGYLLWGYVAALVIFQSIIAIILVKVIYNPNF